MSLFTITGKQTMQNRQQQNKLTSSILDISLKEREGNKRRSQSQNWTTNHRQHTGKKANSLVWTCYQSGLPAYTTRSTVLEGTRIQERTRSTTKKLERHCQQRSTKDGVHLGGSKGGSSLQTWLAFVRKSIKVKVMHRIVGTERIARRL